MKSKKMNDALTVLAGVALILIVGVSVFLFNHDGGLSGFQILAREGAGFWATAIGASALTYFIVRWAKKTYDRTQEGTSVIPFIIAIAILFLIAFAKACDDKANGGVTTPKGRIEQTK